MGEEVPDQQTDKCLLLSPRSSKDMIEGVTEITGIHEKVLLLLFLPDSRVPIGGRHQRALDCLPDY